MLCQKIYITTGIPHHKSHTYMYNVQTLTAIQALNFSSLLLATL